MKIPLFCDSKTTLYSAIFASMSRVQLISKELLLYASLNSWKLTIVAGRCAELSVLQYALSINFFQYELCEIRQSYLCKGAALAGDLIKLQWLHTGKGCPMTSAVSERAASSGSVEDTKVVSCCM
jgi:hypothetical protein